MLQILPRPLAFHHFPIVHTRQDTVEVYLLVRLCRSCDLGALALVLANDIFLASSSLLDLFSDGYIHENTAIVVDGRIIIHIQDSQHFHSWEARAYSQWQRHNAKKTDWKAAKQR